MECIGRYRLEGRIASGGMADVHLARLDGPGGFSKKFVIKTMRPELRTDPQFVEMFHSEARLAAMLAHPNVVQVLDFGKDGDHFYIAMEYVEGATLRTLASLTRSEGEGAPLPPVVVAHAMAGVCAGAAYVHELRDAEGAPLGLLHRDISPDNIIVSTDGIAKLLDFGVAKATNGSGPKTTAGSLKGKLAYMSPEQVRGLPLDARTDVYSLGVTLYELLAGRRPLIADNELELALSVLERTPPPLAELAPHVPPALVAIVERAMHRELRQRFASARELQESLEGFAASGLAAAQADLRARVKRAVAARPLMQPARPPPPPPPETPTRREVPLPRRGPAPGEEATVVTSIARPPGAPVRRGTVVALLAGALVLLIVTVASLLAVRAQDLPPERVAEAAGAPMAPAQQPAQLQGTASPPLAATSDAAARTSRERSEPERTAAPEPMAEPAPTAEPEPEPTPARRASAPQEPRSKPRSPKEARTARATRRVAGEGTLTLRSNPWCHVSVNGERVGTTPLLDHKLPAGPHRVLLTNGKLGARRALVVEVEPGGSVERAVVFPLGLVRIEASAGTRVFRGSELLGVAPLEPVELVAGKHALGFVDPVTRALTTRTVVVKQDQTVAVSAP